MHYRLWKGRRGVGVICGMGTYGKEKTAMRWTIQGNDG